MKCYPVTKPKTLTTLSVDDVHDSSSNEMFIEAKKIAVQHENCSGTEKIKMAKFCTKQEKMFDEEKCECVSGGFSNEAHNSSEIVLAVYTYEDREYCTGKEKLRAAVNCTKKNGMLNEINCECIL